MKQAVVGMGEQMPMETLLSFVDSAWTNDETLVDRGKPNPLFAYTRWSNLYSTRRLILEAPAGTVTGIRDIAVQPRLDEKGRPAPGEPRHFFTHTKYWTLDPAAATIPHHIDTLRKALRLRD